MATLVTIPPRSTGLLLSASTDLPEAGSSLTGGTAG